MRAVGTGMVGSGAGAGAGTGAVLSKIGRILLSVAPRRLLVLCVVVSLAVYPEEGEASSWMEESRKVGPVTPLDDYCEEVGTQRQWRG